MLMASWTKGPAFNLKSLISNLPLHSMIHSTKTQHFMSQRTEILIVCNMSKGPRAENMPWAPHNPNPSLPLTPLGCRKNLPP